MNTTPSLDMLQAVVSRSPSLADTLALSVVIPAHNEADILESLVRGITSEMARLGESHYELILCENGSTDATLEIARRLAQTQPQLVIETIPQASYGAAIKTGILASHGERIVLFNADLWDIPFLVESIRLLAQYDIVVASKRHAQSKDQRPWNRRLITWGFNRVLRLLFGFRGTDTHGMKAFNRAAILPIIQQCVTDKEIFDTEVILRAQRAGLRIVEVPTVVEETRPSRYGPFVRIPRTLRDLKTLYRALK